MLRSELNQLEILVGEVLEKIRTIGGEITERQLDTQTGVIRKLCGNLKAKWIHELFGSAKEQVISRYIQYHVAGITHLSNGVYREMPAIDQATGKQEFITRHLTQMLNELEELLTFLHHQYYRYFDLDYKITDDHCRRYRTDINKYIVELASYSGPDIDLTLVAAIGSSFQEMTDEASLSGITYRHAEHKRNLLRMLDQLIHSVKATTSDSLAKALYRQNFNTLHFLNWYQGYLQQQIGNLPGKAERDVFIAQFLKAISAVFVDPEKAFEPELPSIDLVLLPWLIGHLDDSKNANGNLINPAEAIQLPLNLSVSQFAMFVRISSQVGCFPDTNVSRITRFFTQHFTTKKQSNISPKSFARAFYSLDQASAAVIRDYLQKMINYLNKTYFP